MADQHSAERQTDGERDEARRQFMERFGKLALAAAPAAAVLLTSMSKHAIAHSCKDPDHDGDCDEDGGDGGGGDGGGGNGGGGNGGGG
jgi:hypothetical protein